jgi:hypothetical protein
LSTENIIFTQVGEVGTVFRNNLIKLSSLSLSLTHTHTHTHT